MSEHILPIPAKRAAPQYGGPTRIMPRRLDFIVWWREVDRVLLFLVIALMLVGTVAVAAASPASAERLSTSNKTLSDLYFFWQQMGWQMVGLMTLVAASFLTRDDARRLGILLSAGMIAMLLLVPLIGVEVNGARRWINLGMRFQPSEFLKPGFAILIAWVLSWRMRDPNLPVLWLAAICCGLVIMLLALQPNFGDALLFVGTWFVMIVMSGISVKRIAMLGSVGIALLTITYFLYDNARNRIDAFLGGGTAYDQVDLAQRTLLAGGWTGTGFWLGLKKMNLPEAHTDYIFSVIGEEFGLLACAIVVLLYLAIIMRILMRVIEEEDMFAMLAATGLTVMFGGQAFINILVNLQLFPSKGMTLPLVSYGGSSTIAICLTIGLLLAITKRNPFLRRQTPGLARLFDRPDDEGVKGTNLGKVAP